MSDKAQAVEDALAGGFECPFCGSFYKREADRSRVVYVLCWCGKTYYTRKPDGKAYKVGRYWTTSWEDAYSYQRPPGAKPVRARKPFDEDSWMKGVNRNKPKRSNARSGAKRSARARDAKMS